MRIAFTHNLQRSDAEEEAEFDSAETVALLSESMRRLGHEVTPVDVSGSVSHLVARLEALAPDLIFNTAEGLHGRYREAFYPALFEQLGIPYTASDAYVCALTLDKHATKALVARRGVPTPRWVFVDRLDAAIPGELAYPLFVKPNFEGSSKGITERSVVADRAELDERIGELLPRYPAGLLVEELVRGRDIVVPFIEGVSPETGGVLPAVEYTFDAGVAGARAHTIYDYDLKHRHADAVTARVCSELDLRTAERIRALAERIFDTLGIRDLGRIDFRLDESGEPVFLEVNALPSLEPGAGIYVAAEHAGVGGIDAVIGAVIASACERYGLSPRAQRGPKPARVGLIFNLKRRSAGRTGSSSADDREAEYDAPETVAAIREAIEGLGHDVVELEADASLVTRLPAAAVDVAFNIAEGLRGRNREAVVPALLEHLDIPYTGSDPATLAVTLDKALAKRIVRQAGVRTPDFLLLSRPSQKLPAGFSYPAIVKPVAEGSSKGVRRSSVVTDEASLRAEVEDIVRRYDQPALVEEFLPGREFTVGLLGGGERPTVLPPMEIVFGEAAGPHPIYSYEHKTDVDKSVRFDAPATLDPPLQRAIESAARRSFVALGCRDVARIDLRLDAKGRPAFVECNPLPGLTPGWSDLCVIADSAGISYAELIERILAPALRRRQVASRRKALVES